MATSVTKVVKQVTMTVIPEGKFEGIWSGYIVKLEIDGEQYELTTTDGIRSLRAECWVHSSEGKIWVTTK